MELNVAEYSKENGWSVMNSSVIRRDNAFRLINDLTTDLWGPDRFHNNYNQVWTDNEPRKEAHQAATWKAFDFKKLDAQIAKLHERRDAELQGIGQREQKIQQAIDNLAQAVRDNEGLMETLREEVIRTVMSAPDDALKTKETLSMLEYKGLALKRDLDHKVNELTELQTRKAETEKGFKMEEKSVLMTSIEGVYADIKQTVMQAKAQTEVFDKLRDRWNASELRVK